MAPPASAAPADAAARTSATPAALPTRLAAPVWLDRLDVLTAGAHTIEVALGEGDGTVRLRTHRDGEGLSVVVRFSDPELGALAGAHVRQIAEALEAHFAEPVRLALGEQAADGGTGDRPQRDAPTEAGPGPAATPTPPSDTPTLRALGPREWVG